jgi:hypothetical protein
MIPVIITEQRKKTAEYDMQKQRKLEDKIRRGTAGEKGTRLEVKGIQNAS